MNTNLLSNRVKCKKRIDEKNSNLSNLTRKGSSNQFESLEEENIFVIFKSALRRHYFLVKKNNNIAHNIDHIVYIVNQCVPVKYKTLQAPNNLTHQICFASKILFRIQHSDPYFGIR